MTRILPAMKLFVNKGFDYFLECQIGEKDNNLQLNQEFIKKKIKTSSGCDIYIGKISLEVEYLLKNDIFSIEQDMINFSITPKHQRYISEGFINNNVNFKNFNSNSKGNVLELIPQNSGESLYNPDDNDDSKIQLIRQKSKSLEKLPLLLISNINMSEEYEIENSLMPSELFSNKEYQNNSKSYIINYTETYFEDMLKNNLEKEKFEIKKLKYKFECLCKDQIIKWEKNDKNDYYEDFSIFYQDYIFDKEEDLNTSEDLELVLQDEINDKNCYKELEENKTISYPPYNIFFKINKLKNYLANTHQQINLNVINLYNKCINKQT